MVIECDKYQLCYLDGHPELGYSMHNFEFWAPKESDAHRIANGYLQGKRHAHGGNLYRGDNMIKMNWKSER